MDSLLTIDQVLQRCQDEIPGFSAIDDAKLGSAWAWEALRRVKSSNLGRERTITVEIQDGEGSLPNDFLWLNASTARHKAITIWRPGWESLSYDVDGPLGISYQAIKVDANGFPMVPELLDEAVRAWIYYKYIELLQRKRWIKDASVRIDQGMNKENETKALGLIDEARGHLNRRTASDMELQKLQRESRTYRNRR
ncbi:MAG: hypothetical protein EOO39_00505 [Cytophagaceae bacterium]|nr:MAG: hypothetical protein EOO39_00505 [Cytophagaceae bacterium]